MFYEWMKVWHVHDAGLGFSIVIFGGCWNHRFCIGCYGNLAYAVFMRDVLYKLKTQFPYIFCVWFFILNLYEMLLYLIFWYHKSLGFKIVDEEILFCSGWLSATVLLKELLKLDPSLTWDGDFTGKEILL